MSVSSALTDSSIITASGTGAAIGYGTLANTGTIRSTGGIGVMAYIANAATNAGTIAGATTGFALNSGRLTNSGTIESRKAAAITLGYGTTLANEATGTIRAATAVDVSNGGMIVNRGGIVGNVAASAYSYGSTVYVADGGTLSGNLTLGQGYDLFLQTGDTTGVTGTIDGGAGFDTFGYLRKASGSIALDQRPGINFEADYVEALGADTRVTLTAAQGIGNAVYLQGDGTIINDATIDGGASTYLPIGMVGLGQGNMLAALVNRGTITGGVNGAVQSFTNSGTVGNSTLDANGVGQWLTAGSFAFDNSGTILSSGIYDAVSLGGTALTGLSVTNSGTITGGWTSRRPSPRNRRSPRSPSPTSAAQSRPRAVTPCRSRRAIPITPPTQASSR